MRRPRNLELRAELVAHQLARGIVGELDAELSRDPLLDRPEAPKAVGLGQGLLQGLELVRRQGFALASRHIDREQRGQATLTIGREPASHGIAIHAEQRRDLLARVRLVAGEEVERVQAGALGGMPFLAELSLQLVGGLSNRGQRLAHRSIPSAEHVVVEGYRAYALCARPFHISYQRGISLVYANIIHDY